MIGIGPLAAFMEAFRARPLLVAAWLMTAALAMNFATLDLGHALADPLWRVSPGTLLGRDFVNVFTGGHMVLGGNLDLIYDVQGYRTVQHDLLDGAVRAHNYSYSPVSFFYVWLFALTGYGVAFWLWTLSTGAAFAFAARPYLRSASLPLWLAVLTPASIINVWAGHYGFLFGAIWLTAWRFADSRPRLSGLLVGLMIVKPHLALLMPIALLRRKAWLAILYAALTVLCLVVLSGLAFGWQHWVTYLTHTSAVQAAMIEDIGAFFLHMMPTVFPAAALAGVGIAAAWLIQGCAAAAAIGALWRWMPADPMRAGLATMTATFLVLPYAFNYDLTVVGIAALIALHRTADSAPAILRIGAALAFLLPLIVIIMNGLGVPLAPLALALMLALLLRPERVGGEARPHRPAPALA